MALAVATALMLLGLQRGFHAWRQARFIEDTPTSRIRSAAQGYVELAGRVRLMPGDPILAPLSRRPCVWWRYRIEERHEERDHWHSLETQTSLSTFVLADDTGTVLVDPEGAEIRPNSRDEWQGDAPWPVAGPPPFKGFRGFGNRYRYLEERLDIETTVHALGRLVTERVALEVLTADTQAQLLATWKRDPAMRAQLDTNGDGELDLPEWEQAREQARLRARELNIAAAGGAVAAASGEVFTRLQRPDDQRPYWIGATAPHRLVRSYRWRALAWLLAVLGGLLAWPWLVQQLTAA